MNAEALKRKIKVCMFDQYGTVVDMQGGLTEVAAAFLEGEGLDGQRRTRSSPGGGARISRTR